MTRSKAIKGYCLECSGGSAKEVTMCPIPDCSLYPFRFGNSPKSVVYKKRMKTAARNYPEEYKKVLKCHEPRKE